MRNGNTICWLYPSNPTWFLSYLWGMETLSALSVHSYIYCSYPTYEEWKQICLPQVEQKPFASFLSYLWGMETIRDCGYRETIYKVLILPMRNGNFFPFLLVGEKVVVFGSYPTYEEWKPYFGQETENAMANAFLSYLWGMETFAFLQVSVLFLRSSYPTYEEWKPYNRNRIAWKCTRFLSYLWGMETN